MSAPRVSVVVPTRNGASTLPAMLDALWAQKTMHPLDIIAVDSGSTDATRLDLIAGRVRTVVRIPDGEFDHGLSRKCGIERARATSLCCWSRTRCRCPKTGIDRLVARCWLTARWPARSRGSSRDQDRVGAVHGRLQDLLGTTRPPSQSVSPPVGPMPDSRAGPPGVRHALGRRFRNAYAAHCTERQQCPALRAYPPKSVWLCNSPVLQVPRPKVAGGNLGGGRAR
jgi:hypothetical protein